jgi:chemotaxis protein CheD
VTLPHAELHVERFTLAQGEIFMSDQPAAVTTLLGSCIAACMHDPVTKRGAICHTMLPNAPVVLHREPFRYVDEAILFLLERYRRMEIPPERLTIKLFGGADVLPRTSGEYESIGRQNTMAALETLGWQGLHATVRETGGDRGRKIVFMPHTGDVFMRRLNPVLSRQVAQEQRSQA